MKTLKLTSRIIAVSILINLAGCMDLNRRAIVIKTPNMPIDTVTQIDVVLELQRPIIDQKTLLSLNGSKWDSGSFAKKFTSRLSMNFAERGIKIIAVDSKWGAYQRIQYALPSTDTVKYKMVIEPETIEYMVRSTNTSQSVTENFAINSKVTLLRNDQIIWAARESVAVAPIDSSGADYFSIGILNGMTDSKLIKPR